MKSVEKERLRTLYTTLRTLLQGDTLSIAFSGGLDSRFLAHVAALEGLKPLLLIANGPHCAPAEYAFACEWAALRGLEVCTLAYNPLELDAVAHGQPDRCYHCKKGLFTRLRTEARGTLCDGTHASDHNGYRPGLRALAELHITSPLAVCGLEKKDIRALAHSTGLENPEQKARPCLLTRLPYHAVPTTEILRYLSWCEEQVAQLLQDMLPTVSGMNFPDFRVRCIPKATVSEEMSAEVHLSGLPHDFSLDEFRQQLAARQLSMPVRVLETMSGYFDT